MTTAVAPPATTGGSTRRRRLIVALVGLVALAVVATFAWRVLDDRFEAPQVLGPSLGGFSMVADPVPLGDSTMQIGFMAPYTGEEDPETLTFHSAEVHFRRNTAAAVATISVCLPRTSPNGNIGGGGTARASTLEKYCREARPVVPGTTLQWGTESTDGEFLVLTVRPTRPGTADIDSLSLDYTRDDEHGGRRGVERVEDQRFVVRVS